MTKFFLFAIALGLFVSCNNSSTGLLSENDKIKVAVFNGNGASATCITETYEALKIDTGIYASEISSAEIESGKLSEFDAIVFPGGSASSELNNLGASGAEKVINFIREGNGALGICAGGYLFSTTKGYPSLQLVSATEWDREHYDKGRALVEFALTDKGKELFPELASEALFLQYYDGPVLFPSDSGKSNTKDYEEFGVFVSDIQIKKNYPSGITPGKTFLLGEAYEKGKTIVISGHPESTPGMRWMVPRMVRWAINKPLISYPEKWIRPELYDSAIFFNTELAKREKSLYWQLFEKEDSVKLNAMEKLYQMHSRPAVRWNLGLLRDQSPEVRKMAALYLMKNEYSAALPDLQAALINETNQNCITQIEESIDFLSHF